MIRVIRTGSNLAQIAAGVIGDALRDEAGRSGRASFAASGGRTPRAVFDALAGETVPWSQIDVFQVDERVAPPGDEARNGKGLTEALLDRVPARFHPMPVESEDLAGAADRYGNELPRRLDVVHLGLGDDGHTASLVPGDPAVLVDDRDVTVTEFYRGHRRMTLTRPALDRAGLLVWIVSGGGKGEMVERLLAADPGIPAGLVSQQRAVLITDSI